MSRRRIPKNGMSALNRMQSALAEIQDQLHSITYMLKELVTDTRLRRRRARRRKN